MKKKTLNKKMTKIILSLLITWTMFPCSGAAQTSPKYEKTPDMQWEGYTGWTKEQRLYALSKFWMEAKYNFVYMSKIGANRWDSLYNAYIPKAIKDQNDYEFYRLMCRFCAFLNDGHTSVMINRPFNIITNYFADGWYLSTEYVDGKILVTEVSKEKTKEVPLGSEIIELNGLPIKESLKMECAHQFASTDMVALKRAGQQLLRGLEFSTYKIKFRTPGGKEKDVTLHHEYLDGYDKLEIVKLHPEEKSDKNKNFLFKWYPKDVAYLKIGTFMRGRGVEEGIKNALPELQKRAKKIIIDLRDNEGGNSGFAATIMGHFISGERASDGRWSTPTYNAAFASWGKSLQPKDTINNPELKTFYLHYHNLAMHDGGLSNYTFSANHPRVVVPTLILTNYKTGSSCENLLVMADGQKHIKTIGETTSGSTGNPIGYTLIPGMFCKICTIENLYPDGREFVGIGIKPDIEIRETVENFIKGKDYVLEAALKHFGSKNKEEKKN